MEERHDDDDDRIFMCFCVQLQRFQDNLKQSPFQAEITMYQFRTLVEGTLMLEFSLSYKVGFDLRKRD